MNIHIYTDIDTLFGRACRIWMDALLLETTDGLDVPGIEPGVHLMMADHADMPQACAALLKDAGKRQAMVTSAQALLRERFLPQHWSQKMLAVLAIMQGIR